MDSIKIAYIGGGSKEWARTFMNDLALSSGLSGEVALYDIDLASAIRNKKIGERINESDKTVSRFKYEVYENLADALTGADFVVISILPGTFEEMRSDVHTPERYGIYQSVGDTAGPGGVLRAMRTVPVYFDFARAIEKYCPNAWVINYTNPMSICVKALYDTFPKIKAFGCCHEVFHTQDMLCAILKDVTGVSAARSELETVVSGVNHFTWITTAKYKDTDILALLPDFINSHYETGFSDLGSCEDYLRDPFACANRVKFDMYRRYGVLPTGGDRRHALVQ